MGESISNEAQEASTENPQTCYPRLLAKDGALVMQNQSDKDGGATNVVHWVTDLVDLCPACSGEKK